MAFEVAVPFEIVIEAGNGSLLEEHLRRSIQHESGLIIHIPLDWSIPLSFGYHHSRIQTHFLPDIPPRVLVKENLLPHLSELAYRYLGSPHFPL